MKRKTDAAAMAAIRSGASREEVKAIVQASEGVNRKGGAGVGTAVGLGICLILLVTLIIIAANGGSI